MKCNNIQVIVFDVDGVLTKINSVWRFLHIELGTWNIARKHYKMFMNGEITYEQWAKYDVQLWRGISIENIEKILDKIVIRDGARELISFLKEKGLKIIAISAGLDVLTNKISKEIGIDRAYSNKLVVKNGILTGEVLVDVDFYSKGKILEELFEIFGIGEENIIVVGDSEVDIPMMKKSCFSIAFNPSNVSVINACNIAIFSNSLCSLYPIFKKLLSIKF